MVAGEGVAVGLVQIGVNVAQIKGEHLPGPTNADVPGGVVRERDPVRIEREAAADSRRATIETTGGAEAPMADFAGDVGLHAVRKGGEGVFRGAAEEHARG